MFIGHIGAGLAAKRLAPRTSLGTLVFSAALLDTLWAVFLLLRLEHVRFVPGITRVSPLDLYDYPYSHSLLAVLGWATAAAMLYFALRRQVAGACAVGLAVLSHWFLDWAVHRPDMLLWPRGEMKYGLGLWNNWLAAVGVELLIFCGGLALYLSATRPRNRFGSLGFWTLQALLLLSWVAALRAGAPPTVAAMAWGCLASWSIIVLWVGWADRGRIPRP
jgi:hypothetical protein